MTLDSNPEFWKWLIRKQRENAAQKKGREFEPIPLYIELEKPDKRSIPVHEPIEKSGNHSIIDFTINDDIIIVY